MKKYIILVLITLLIGALFVGVTAAPAGKSNTGLLYLSEKTNDFDGWEDGNDWQIVEGGAWGKMVYTLSGPEFDFVFNGKGLDAGTEYTLIYYPDPWPGSGLICLGSATANGGGNVHIAGAKITGTLPFETDDNFDGDTTYDDGTTGAKIWLVQSNNVSDDELCCWPMLGKFLFEEELINFKEE